MSEKRTESELNTLLGKFPQANIYFTPSEHPDLKKIFRKASKKGGGGAGIPDRLYYDTVEKLLIIFECKASNINAAIKDLKIYDNSIEKISDYKIYYVAVVPGAYDIYSSTFEKMDFKLAPANFGLKLDHNIYKDFQMEKDLHKIHNYIRDYTKISNEDKSYFIACILISLKKESFCTILKSYSTKQYIYDLIKQNLTDYEIDISVFEFLRNDENNKHFLNIINMVKTIYDKSPNDDLLNKFYSEFVKYSNTDGKSLGIVLTPDHITRLMIELLEINHGDIFLDLCTGTGSFAIEALKHKPHSVIAVEYQNKLYNLLKCNMILRGVDLHENRIIKGDCFENEFKATKSAINPPYGMKDKKELDFVIKQLESVAEGGLVAAIIPCAKLSSSKANVKFKKEIMRLGSIEMLIICNQKLFYPNASINTGIVLIKKDTSNKTYHSSRVINYEDDGFKLEKQHGLAKNVKKFEAALSLLRSDIEQTTKNKILTLDNDWLKLDLVKDDYINITDYQSKLFDHTIYQQRAEYHARPKEIKLKIVHGLFKIKDLFKLKTGKCIIKESGTGTYPLITSTSLNNGIAKYINTHSFNDCITVANSGSVGSAFLQEGKFDCTSHVTVLYDPIPAINNKKALLFICSLLEKYKTVYNFGLAWSIQRMKEDTLKLPIDEAGNIIFSILENY
jgi:predicted RNA methylase